jgi:hypothetical protein
MKHLIGQGASAQWGQRHNLLSNRPQAPPTSTTCSSHCRNWTRTATALLDAHITAHGVVHAWQTPCCPVLNILGGSAAPTSTTASKHYAQGVEHP